MHTLDYCLLLEEMQLIFDDILTILSFLSEVEKAVADFMDL